MTWFEDALIELDMNADKYTTASSIMWDGANSRTKLRKIYIIGKGLNSKNLELLYKTAIRLGNLQKEEMINENNK